MHLLAEIVELQKKCNCHQYDMSHEWFILCQLEKNTIHGITYLGVNGSIRMANFPTNVTCHMNGPFNVN